MLRDQIRKDIAKTLQTTDYRLPITNIEVTRTADPKFGDYTTNVAFKLGPKNKQSPQEFAKVLTDSLKSLPYVEKLEVAGPSFINFWIKDSVWQKEVEDVLKIDHLNLGIEKRKVMVEFTDPNPFKEFHIGHLYSNIVGESLCRLLEAIGNTVARVNYQGDVGMHVAKAVWGMRKLLEKHHEDLKAIEVKKLKAKALFLGEAYALGAKAYDDDEKVRNEITDLNKEIYDHPEKIEEYVKGRKWSLEYFEEIYKRLGTKFKFYYFESEVGKIGLELVKKNLKKGIFQESQGALIFPGEKFGLHNRVFVNSLGLPTYEAKELGLAPRKFIDFQYDESIIVTGNEIDEYFKVLIAALKEIDPKLGEKTKHVSHGMVRMPGGKISSRLGNVLLGEWLLDEAEKRVKEAFSIGDDLAEKVGMGAVKYALLKGSVGQDVNFSFDESISLQGNSGPYLQYTFARCQSVLAKGGKAADDFSVDAMEEGERELLLTIGFFQETVLDAGHSLAPNILTSYLYELAQKYNLFYNNLPIIKAPDEIRSRRLGLTAATASVLKQGLYLLGISAPEKM